MRGLLFILVDMVAIAAALAGILALYAWLDDWDLSSWIFATFVTEIVALPAYFIINARTYIDIILKK
ncbi:MAG: hypothetical protein V2I43_12015 [Parvularcula sp.]|jgi:hypothetical protein|nr:hypothetical protein [Parvularcula sp.]